jgi:hypothetical protein
MVGRLLGGCGVLPSGIMTSHMQHAIDARSVRKNGSRF